MYFKNNIQILFFLVVLITTLMVSCTLSKEERIKNSSEEKVTTPVLSPQESIEAMEVEEGFEVKEVASEPLISSPVAMTFDDSMRLWVVEMRSFKPIMENLKEPLPMGRVVILKDETGDGKMDSKKVFMDSLHVPRAIKHVEDGLLLATPPELWYIKIKDDTPVKKVLIDSAYTATNNTEGQTNGLYRSLDNWIYDVGFGSDKRYRKIGDKWYAEPTHLRGQWGVSQDNYGRLFYNHHSTQLKGDYFMPGLGSGNEYQDEQAGFNELIVPDQRVYPLKPTPGVVKPYQEDMLNEDLTLKHFTAASGPLIYRGGLFGDEYKGNAFVCEPAGNLVKRNILNQDGFKITGEQAYKEKEFLASTDERFRPVNLYDGPDGGLYMIDMYRGVIQDSMWMSEHLKKYSINHNLDQPINRGRIYKIVPAGGKHHIAVLPDSMKALVALLADENGWMRDRAQQKLIDGQYTDAIPKLRDILKNKDSDILATIHALWTLEGLRDLTIDDIRLLLQEYDDRHIKKHSLNASKAILNNANYEGLVPELQKLISDGDSLIAPNIAFVINSIRKYNPAISKKLNRKLIEKYSQNIFVTDAIISGLRGEEEAYLEEYANPNLLIHKRLLPITRDINNSDNSSEELAEVKAEYPVGFAQYESLCQTCHGVDGNGIKSLGPPLDGSEWINGSKNLPISIILNGLTGPVEVKGKLYEKPETSGVMPSFKDVMSDEEIAGLLNFLRNAWGNNTDKEVSKNDVKKIRATFESREEAFKAKELLKIYKNKNSHIK